MKKNGVSMPKNGVFRLGFYLNKRTYYYDKNEL